MRAWQYELLIESHFNGHIYRRGSFSSISEKITLENWSAFMNCYPHDNLQITTIFIIKHALQSNHFMFVWNLINHYIWESSVTFQPCKITLTLFWYRTNGNSGIAI